MSKEYLIFRKKCIKYGNAGAMQSEKIGRYGRQRCNFLQALRLYVRTFLYVYLR